MSKPRRSKTIAEKLNGQIAPINESDQEILDLLNTCVSPQRFDNKLELKDHLSEGALLNVNVLGSKALSIPSGEYVVWAIDAGHTMLVPTNLINNGQDVYTKTEDKYEITTPSLLNNWNKVEKVLSESILEDEDLDSSYTTDEDDEDYEDEEGEEGEDETSMAAGQFQSGIQMGTVDRSELARALQSQGMTEKELADKVGVDKSTISRLLREPNIGAVGDPGGRNPSLNLLGKIVKALRIPPHSAMPDILGGSAEPGEARQMEKTTGSGQSGRASGDTRRSSGSWEQGNK